MAKNQQRPTAPSAVEDDAEGGHPASRWLTAALEAAKEPGPYPKWLTGTVKAVIAIGLLTLVADWAAQRSAKADLARLFAQTSTPKPEPAKTGSTRR